MTDFEFTGPLCRNAYVGERAWYCYHYAGKPTAGKEHLNEKRECEACEKVSGTVDTLPSFMLNEEDE